MTICRLGEGYPQFRTPRYISSSLLTHLTHRHINPVSRQYYSTQYLQLLPHGFSYISPFLNLVLVQKCRTILRKTETRARHRLSIKGSPKVRSGTNSS
ncbi:unnamed protein product [Periconia digitata]|uniref:Uncharacterized protein n=1 Tax=Periconia digitata TaxID=1303443 RepID=A0A9W4XQ45_9PLEO|nr:unnamed protein product [Periconia digitata]